MEGPAWTGTGASSIMIRMLYPDADTYRRRLERDAELPEGFQASSAKLTFVPPENPKVGSLPMTLSLVRTTAPTSSFAAVFTKNAFPGWPVILGRRLLDEPFLQGFLVNNKVSNVRAEGGLDVSRRLAARVAEAAGDDAHYLPSSTGVIGWTLPEDAMMTAIPDLVGGLQSRTLLPVAQGIMTTDAWPKVRSEVCGEGRVMGTAKGAGMIEPNMATMLSFILTDVAVPREAARRLLKHAVDMSFNRMSIDGETSTSDTVLLMASGKQPYPGDRAFSESLERVCRDLAEDVVRNGEGTSHVFRVRVKGATDQSQALLLARSIANAPLTKTAIRGNDPNVGRVIQALGSACARCDCRPDPESVTLAIGGRVVYSQGAFRLGPDEEKALSDYMAQRQLPSPQPGWPVHEEIVDIDIDLAGKGGEAAVLASDLTEEYVRINADYRT